MENEYFLKEHLGAKLTQYLDYYGTKDDLELARMAVEQILRDGDTDATIQAWFQGMNPALGDIAPARFIVRKDMSVESKWKYLKYAIAALG